jgi:hypothetical protein
MLVVRATVCTVAVAGGTLLTLTDCADAFGAGWSHFDFLEFGKKLKKKYIKETA